MYIIKIYFGKFKKNSKDLVVKNTKEGKFHSISNENGDITICINISEISVLPPYEFLISGMYGCKGRTYKKKSNSKDIEVRVAKALKGRGPLMQALFS